MNQALPVPLTQDVPLELPEADGGPLACVSQSQRVMRAVAAHGHHSHGRRAGALVRKCAAGSLGVRGRRVFPA